MSKIERKGRGYTVWEVEPEDFRQSFQCRTESLLVPAQFFAGRERPRLMTVKGVTGHGHQSRFASEPPAYGCLYLELSHGRNPNEIELVNTVVPVEKLHYEEANWPGGSNVFLGVPSEYTKIIAKAISDILACRFTDPVCGVQVTIKHGAYHPIYSNPRLFDSIARDVMVCCLEQARTDGQFLDAEILE